MMIPTSVVERKFAMSSLSEASSFTLVWYSELTV